MPDEGNNNNNQMTPPVAPAPPKTPVQSGSTGTVSDAPNGDAVRSDPQGSAALDEAHYADLAKNFPDTVAREHAIANAIAQGGHPPVGLDVTGPDPEHEVVFPELGLEPAAPTPRGLWAQSATYAIPERDIFASSIGRRVTSYTFDAATLTADANGNKVVMEGTVVSMSGVKLQAHTSDTAVGVLGRRINGDNGDVDVPLVLSGMLREDKCWDNGVFGTVTSGAKTALAGTGIYFIKYDV